MKYMTARQIKRLDRIAVEQYGIPSLILMENAGRGIADLAQGMMGRKRNILVVSGKGNNGGDGFVAARHLANRGFKVQVVLLLDLKKGDRQERLSAPFFLKDDPKINYAILKKMDVPIEQVTSEEKIGRFKTLVKQSDLILDGIFGIGLQRAVSGLFYHVISILNRSKKPILAIDIPSGLDSDSGKELGVIVNARATGTLALPKRGLFLGRGPAHAGKITVIDISIPKRLVRA